MELITKDIKNYAKAEENYLSTKKKIEDRITEILGIIYQAFDIKEDLIKLGVGLNSVEINTNWGWPVGEEREIMSAPKAEIFNKEIFNIYIVYPYEGISGKLRPKIDTKFWDYNTSWPTKFLTMPNEAILAHIQSEIEKEEIEEKEKTKTIEQEQQAKKDLKKKALSKLSKEEKEILGIK